MNVEVVITTLAATLCMQAGFFLWKLSASNQPKLGVAPARQVLISLITDVRWVTGTIASTAGWVLFIRATSIGEISFVQPLMSAGDVVLVLLAVVVLKERLRLQETAGLVVTVAGALWLSLGATTVRATSWSPWALLAFLTAAAALAALSLLVSRRLTHAEVPLAVAVGTSFGLAAVLTKAWTAGDFLRWESAVDPLVWGIVLSNALGLILMQTAFQRGRASVVVPVQLAVANAVAVMGGTMLFAESLPLQRLAAVGVIVVGAALLHAPARPGDGGIRPA